MPLLPLTEWEREKFPIIFYDDFFVREVYTGFDSRPVIKGPMQRKCV
jgi:hypothetical protein